MRIVALVILALAILLCPCWSATAAKQTDYTQTYTAHILDAYPSTEPAEAWFVDNKGVTIGPASLNGSWALNIWQPHKKKTRLADVPDEASYYIMALMNWNVRRQRMSNRDEMIYASMDGSVVGVVDILRGKTRTLGKLAGIGLYTAVDINDSGVCVGNACRGLESGDPTLPIVWSEKGIPRLLALPDKCTNAQANGINNRGQIVGNAWNDYWQPEGRVVIWNTDGTIAKEIPQTPEEILMGQGASGLMISDNGYVLLRGMWSYDLISPTDTRTQIAYHIMGDDVFAMNARAQIAGYDNEGAVIFNPDGSTIHLPSPIPGAYCAAYDINDDGVVVGAAENYDPYRRAAVVWTPND